MKNLPLTWTMWGFKKQVRRRVQRILLSWLLCGREGKDGDFGRAQAETIACELIAERNEVLKGSKLTTKKQEIVAAKAEQPPPGEGPEYDVETILD